MSVDTWDSLGLDFPSKIQLQTINLCNYACGMCPYPELARTRPKQLLADELYHKLLAELRERKREVQLCLMLQNEPLLDRRFVDFVARANEHPFVSRVASVSNGSVLDRETLDRLTSFDRFHLTISVNATERGRYRDVHGRDRFEAVRALLDGWTGPRHKVVLSCVVSADRPRDFVDFERYWQPLGYPVRMVPMSSRISAKPLNRAVLRVVPDFGRCRYPLDTMTILADGRVVLCGQDWMHSACFGNIAEQTLYEIWNGDALSSIRRAVIDGRLRDVSSCAGCDYPMRSAARVELEHELGGSTLPRLSSPVLPHRSYLRHDNGEQTPIAVKEIDAAGSILVYAAERITEQSEQVEFVMCFAYENGYFSEMPCRARLTPERHRSTKSLWAYRAELDAADPRSALFAWYAEDWNRGRMEAAC